MTQRLCSFLLLLGFASAALIQAQPAPLTVQKIMQDPDTWIGSWPSQPFWSEDGETVYFFWNPQGQFPSDSLYKVPREGGEPIKVTPEDRRAPRPRFNGWHHGEQVYTADFTRKVYAEDGDIFLYNRQTKGLSRLTRTQDRENNPRFTLDGSGIIFERGDNLYHLDLTAGGVTQITDLRSGNERGEDQSTDEQDTFLKEQQTILFDYIREQQEEDKLGEEARERDAAAENPPPTFYAGSKNIQQLQIDPTEQFVTFTLSERNGDSKGTKAISYVTESGYAEELTARPKVGVPGGATELYIQDLERDTTFQVNLHQVEGAYDVPEYQREQGIEVDSSKTKRTLYSFGPFWSGDGRYAIVEIRTRDNKDRWITRLDPMTGDLTVLDRQHDEAWIAGPGISWFGGGSDVGWLPDNRHFFFQSEKTGYSHLYTVDVENGTLNQLTSGDFEVFDPALSQDGQMWTFTSSEVSPHVRHFYRMPVDGGTRTQLTSMTGNNDVSLSPDGEVMAMQYSFTNQPPEIYLQAPQGEAERITHSTMDEWEAYRWRAPEIVRFEASDGAMVPAQIFEPENPNGAAVLFVHGAGYLQNVHQWWSGYFREYMFHNLLTDLGYVVVNADYRASAGYGRDWRTAIYRHMGGRDLQDYVDASEYVADTYDIDPERIAIYGGSYGGFITLMALFTEPEHFGAGAALRSVTDWAHYNHTYTANILNTPVTDSLAYARSSPINFAEGLEDPLLMPHGLVDTNVQFQDIIRLTQRLIELGKEDWELAVYPVEGHGFTEPASWTDEYRRILDLIETHVGPNRLMEAEPMMESEGER
ncbi:MAG TPA: prolyl oligopeptidase family serine peptidase [Rhodothermales bacterium]|nr:prolyl oligopeptidase family serine peptidase [Rhodothermales bacterium]